jgi:hypothetical protein
MMSYQKNMNYEASDWALTIVFVDGTRGDRAVYCGECTPLARLQTGFVSGVNEGRSVKGVTHQITDLERAQISRLGMVKRAGRSLCGVNETFGPVGDERVVVPSGRSTVFITKRDRVHVD